jgi:hypothetical protein
VQSVSLLTSAQQTAFTAAIRYFGPATGCLSVNPVSGTAPANLEISANAKDLAAGTYRGQVIAGISELPSQTLSVTAGKGASNPVRINAVASSSGN